MFLTAHSSPQLPDTGIWLGDDDDGGDETCSVTNGNAIVDKKCMKSSAE